jgi:predicted GNAT family N-acyltransferase
VDASDFPEQALKSLRVPNYQRLPATLIGRLARDLRAKGKGVGELLLMAALKQALDTSKRIASLAVVVDAKDNHAKDFYKKYGFVDLPDHPDRLFLPMKAIEEMFR